MKSIKYLCYYDIPDNKNDQRRYALSAANVISYITECISLRENAIIELVSVAGSNNNNGCKGSLKELSSSVSLKSFSSIGRGGRIRNIIDYYSIQIKAFLYLLVRIRKNDTLLVYHSIYYMNLVKLIKRIKHINLVLQVEEIYGDVMDDKKLRARELDYFAKANSYIFPTKMLNNCVNTDNKPYVVIHGTYKTEQIRDSNKYRMYFEDKYPGMIHCVYAGTLDPRKGCIAAATAALFLPSNYYIHIIGFGTESEVDNINSVIEDVSRKTKAKVSYDGVLTGDDYIQFLQSCDIGLSPQDPNAEFNSTSFPSKILSYLSNGIRVVTIDIPAIRSSSVGVLLYYYKEQTPLEISKTIQNVDLSSIYDSRKYIENLSLSFKKELNELLF